MYEPEFLSVPRGQAVCTQNDPVDAVYHLVQGECSLWHNSRFAGRLAAGHLIGLDGAYAPAGVYPCTAQTECACRVAVFSVHDIPEALLTSPRLAETTVFSLSKQLQDGWERLAAAVSAEAPSFVGEVLSVEAGTVIIEEGEAGDDVYRIVSTAKGLEVSSQGEVLAVLDRPGEFFGEMAAMLQEPRTATVRSLGRSVLEVYPASLLPRIVADYPELSWRLIQGLSRRLKDTNLRLRSKSA